MPKPNALMVAVGVGKPPKKGADEEDLPIDEEEAPPAEEEDYAENESEYPEFSIPASLPELNAMEEGEEKEVMATIRKKGDGACLVKLEGADLAGGAPEELPPEAPVPPPPPPGGIGMPGGEGIRQRAMTGGLM